MSALALLASACLSLPLASSALALDYANVTDERLANPEPHNWLQYRGNNQGWGYSPLDQITTGNVSKLDGSKYPVELAAIGG